MTDEKQDAVIKQRAAEIASTALISTRLGNIYTSPNSIFDAVERALREGMAMRVPDGLISTIKEAAALVEELAAEGTPVIRGPLADELYGFAAMLARNEE